MIGRMTRWDGRKQTGANGLRGRAKKVIMGGDDDEGRLLALFENVD